MLQKSLIALALVFGLQAGSSTLTTPLINLKALQSRVQQDVGTQGLPWLVGESASYQLDMGFLKGKMVMTVRELTSEGFWIQQDIDLMIQKQKVEILFDKDTGQVKKVLVDGKQQQMPDGGEQEIVESKPDSVTVPAGTFECAYLKVRDLSQNSTTELWVNPEIIPVMGLIKQIAESQLGPVTMSLTSFVKK